MRRYDGAFGEAAKQVQRAATKTVNDFSAGTLPDEHNFTSSFITRIHDYLEGFAKDGIAWRARILSPRHEEKEFGADFLVGLRLKLPDYSVAKGFLAQAKRQEPGKPLSPSHWSQLVRQCSRMLEHSTESFVFVYARNGVLVVPALGVIACVGHQDLHMLHAWNIRDFYRHHLECWVGQSLDPGTCPPPWMTADIPALNGIEITGTAEGEY